MDVGERRRPGPAAAVMTGPLAAYESLLRAELTRVGYAASSVREATLAMARLSRWMRDEGLAAVDLTAGGGGGVPGRAAAALPQ